MTFEKRFSEMLSKQERLWNECMKPEGDTLKVITFWRPYVASKAVTRPTAITAAVINVFTF
jgi:hypothetical protein